jgi:hypothetical protein
VDVIFWLQELERKGKGEGEKGKGESWISSGRWSGRENETSLEALETSIYKRNGEKEGILGTFWEALGGK